MPYLVRNTQIREREKGGDADSRSRSICSRATETQTPNIRKLLRQIAANGLAAPTGNVTRPSEELCLSIRARMKSANPLPGPISHWQALVAVLLRANRPRGP